MKKKQNFKKIVWICAVVLVVVIGILCIAVPKKTGIDIYVVPRIPVFGGRADYRDYMRIQSDKKSYSISEEITLKANCGFYKPSDGSGASRLRFAIACSEYMDVSISVGTLGEYPGTYDEFYENARDYAVGGIPKTYYLETEDFDSKQLILKRGFFGQIDRDSLQYPFTVTLQVKPDAPENFTGDLYISVYDDRTGYSCITVKFQRDGDTVYLLSN
jgi:hypothetical protein